MDQHAYIARMEAAVQNSLKALSELKRQNALLLEENESLKEKLREYSEGTVRAATEAMDVNSQQVVDEASESRLELNGSCSSNRIDNVRVESSASSVPSNIPANVDNANSSIVPSSRRYSNCLFLLLWY